MFSRCRKMHQEVKPRVVWCQPTRVCSRLRPLPYTACEMMSRKCPKCGRVRQVRVERIYKATERRTT